MNRNSNQLWFSGETHAEIRNEAAAVQFAQGLQARFEAAVPGLDNLIIGWWDGSARAENGGIGIICDVCLPGIPKFSILKARPVQSHGNSLSVELNGGTETCYMINNMLAKCKAKGMLENVAGPLEIILVTDCSSIVSKVSTQHPSTSDSSKRLDPLLRRLKTLSDSILDFGPYVKLDLYHCLRNKCEKTKDVDQLSRDAREKQKAFRSTIEYDTTKHVPRVEEFKNKFEHHKTPPRIRRLDAELKVAMQRFPFRIRNSGRRKQPVTKGGKRVVLLLNEEDEEGENDNEQADPSCQPSGDQHRDKRRRLD